MTNGFRMGSYTCEVDLETGKSLSRLQLNRETHVKDPIAEGPHLFRRGGYYYLHTAEGGTETNHQQWIFRSEVGPYGPWEIGPEGSVNPMIHNGDHPEVMQTGHMDLVEGADGRWWAVFLAVRPQVEGHEKILSQLGRETFLCPVEWKDDWPIVNDRQPVSVSGIQAAGLVRSPAAIKQAFIFSPSTSTSRCARSWH
jgi:beta-xylosidase